VTTVRPATADDLATVLAICNGAALETDGSAVEAAIERGDVLVAADGGPPIGTIVLDGMAVTHVAVRPGRRGQGVGRALVEAAAERRGRIEARFDADLRAFYATLGFDIEPTGSDGRLQGVCTAE
jgi:GNAT superfamily N-acetyltransferase